MFQTKDLELVAADGAVLSGRLVAHEAPSVCVLISSGTGFKKEFYQKTAEYFAARGAAVLLYDYRGIGASRTRAHLLQANLPDWGSFDMRAGIDFLSATYPGLQISHLGHSAGGHLVGFAENQHRIAKHAFVACGSGTWYRHDLNRWAVELYFWWGLGTYALRRWGYLKPVGGWSGDPLPGPVFRTWRRWSSQRRYYADELRTGKQPHVFGDVTAPITSWVFSDDGIATERAAKDILDVYTNAPCTLKLVRPRDLQKRAIGHQGCFRSGFEALWQEWWDWLKA